MKKAVILLSILFAGFQVSANQKVEIPARKSVELTYEEFANFDVKLMNRSGKQIEVSVLDARTRKQVSGFGLGPMGNAILYVAEGNILKLKNTSSKDIRMNLDFVERIPSPQADPNVETVNFTLHNSSLKSIPLIIPGVMNPNLSPMSNSGVSLQMGQEIYYKKGLKRVVVLTVDKNIQNGDKIDMAKRIAALKKEE
ncbi:hypothetical protein [Robiginitalea aurantiaca]|uniref:Gliding motility-associated protein GldM C-terminal domain-containing protein n=1 Tax=Robiginitalea aurantiaca TaxID=3056915 RepID=A0ABT7WIP1_9FLAO|nr:hypothetical protein [Robiginitalea aurantiaca]MDM9632782.1 hypothetical protein [Robiginitalea aurantiaca]